MAYKDVEERKAYHRRWYAENKARRVPQITAYQEREREKFRAYKAAQKCAVCGYCRCARALEFHHLDGELKEATLNEMLRDGVSFAKMLEEVKKCRVLCSNCHRELHDGLIQLPV